MEPTKDTDIMIYRHPELGIVISIVYLILVKKILPAFMNDRPAFKLKALLRIYNVIQVYLNYKLVAASFQTGLWTFFLYVHCIDIYPVDDPYFQPVLEIGKMYIVLKIVDLLDTVFIVLKKKNNQMSFLHLFHHSIVVWAAIYSYSDKERLGFPIAVLNSFVHMIMYSYYLISSFEQAVWVTKYKHHVTQLQLFQFFMVLVYMIYAAYFKCPQGKNTMLIWYFILFVLIFLFGKFYYTEYIVKRRKEKN